MTYRGGFLFAAVTVILAASLVAGCSSEKSEQTTSADRTKATAESTQSSSAEPTRSSSAPPTDPAKGAIEAVGFGRSPGSNEVWVSAIVKDAEPGDDILITFNLLSADGTILATETESRTFMSSNPRMILGTDVDVPPGTDVSKVEATLNVKKRNRSESEFADLIFEIGAVTVGQDSSGDPVAEAILTNPTDILITDPYVGVACFDNAGNIIGGGFDYPDAVPPKSQIKVSVDVTVSESPDKCEMAVQPSALS